MKRILLALALSAAATGSIAQTTYPSGVTSCIARYDFASVDTTITALSDVGGNGNNATVLQNLRSAEGWRNRPLRAMRFNGVNTYARIPDASNLSPNALTMVALVRLDDYYSGPCQYSQIVGKGSPGYVPGQYAMAVSDHGHDDDCNSFNPSQQSLIGYFYNSINMSATHPPAPSQVNLSTWYLLAVAYDGNQVKYYKAVMDSNNHIGNLTPFYSSSGFMSTIGSNSQDLFIGCLQSTPYPYWFNGRMDEVALFNKVLSASEMQSVYDYLWETFSVSTTFTSTNMCPGMSFLLPVTVKAGNAFGPGNTIRVELSDAAGSFASPVTIGTAPLTASGGITCTLPAATPLGSGYKVRLVSSTPYEISPVSEQSITVTATLPAPVVSITATPGVNVLYGQPVTFTATASGAGITPAYQWMKNNASIAGATGATYTTSTLANGDVISVRVRSSTGCAVPDTARSNALILQLSYMGIGQAAAQEGIFRIFPNPSKGSFTVRGTASSAMKTALPYRILSTLGQAVMSGVLHPKSGTVDEAISFPAKPAAGVYLLFVEDGARSTTIPLSIAD